MRKVRIILGIAGLCLWSAGAQAQRLDSAQWMSDFKYLCSDELQGRQAGTEGGQMAREFIRRRMVEIGLTAYVPDYYQSFEMLNPTNQTIRATNVIGYLPGARPGPVMVISAHYDHLGVQEGEIFNGADDNASGVALMLAMAEYYSAHRPEYTLVFAAFDAEEMGLRGARHYVNSLVGSADSLALNVNLDMVSRSHAHQLFASGTYHYPFLKPLLLPLTEEPDRWGVQLLLGHDRPRSHREDWTYSSDHGPFHEQGIPFVYFGVEDHPDYHKATDKYWSIDLDFYQDAGELIMEAVDRLNEALGEINQQP